ncbi:MAG: hypothetical protein LC792_06550 [Actinobacteria bacterium]|nr:hypothetical protein [Actinomycetota bacterium]
MTESEPEGNPAETPEEKRARIMARLAEMIRADPPDLSESGPVTSGSFPVLPTSADEFDQEKAAELFAALGQFFERHRKRPGEESGAEDDPEPESD